MQNRYKRITLDEIYRILKMMSENELSIKYPLEIKPLNNGLGLKMSSAKENVVICMYPDHPRRFQLRN